MEKRTDEINLFDFILMCWKVFVDILRKLLFILLKTIRLSIQNIWILIICVLLGFGVAYFAANQNISHYKLESTVTYNEGMEPYVENGLRLFFSSPHYLLRDTYGMKQNILENIEEVNYYNIVDANVNVRPLDIPNTSTPPDANIRDKTILSPDFVDYANEISNIDSVHVILRDRKRLAITVNGALNINQFKVAIQKFMNDQPEISQADKINRTILENRLKMLNKEVYRLDSLSSYDYFERDKVKNAAGDNSTAIYSETKRNVYYDALLVMINKRDYLQRQLMNNPEIVNFQTNFVGCRTIPRLHVLIYGILGGYILGLIIALLWKYRKTIIKFLKEK